MLKRVGAAAGRRFHTATFEESVEYKVESTCRLPMGSDITRVSPHGPRGAPARPAIPHGSCGHDLELIQQAAPRAAGDMRSEYHVSQAAKRSPAGRGSTACASRPAAGDRTCFQRLVQRVLVDQPAAAGIDEKRRWLAWRRRTNDWRIRVLRDVETFSDTKSERPSKSPSSTNLAPVAVSCSGVARLRLV